MTYVECPRCRLRLNAKLHSITSTDAQECPRCWSLDRIEIPMGFYGARRRPSTAAPRPTT